MKNFIYKLSKLMLLDPNTLSARVSKMTHTINLETNKFKKTLILMVTILIGGITPNWVRLTICIFSSSLKVYRKQGLPGYVKYLKATSVILQQYLGNHKLHDMTPLGPRIARTHDGLPKMFPIMVRKRIKMGDTKMIKVVLTILAIFRSLSWDLSPKFKTITAPSSVSPQGVNSLKPYIPNFIRLFVGQVNLSSLVAPTVFPIWTSSPNSYTKKDKGIFENSTHPASIIRSYIAFEKYPKVWDSLMTIVSLQKESKSFNNAIKICNKYMNRDLIPSYYEYLATKTWRFHGFAVSPLTYLLKFQNIGIIGKLGTKVEAAGKVRVFAMVDPFTQWALYPLHKWIFTILRHHSDIDGTFNQHAPLRKIP